MGTPRFIKVVNNEPNNLLAQLQQPFLQKLEDNINYYFEQKLLEEINDI